MRSCQSVEPREDDAAVGLVGRGDHVQALERDRVLDPLLAPADRLDALDDRGGLLAAGAVGRLDHADQVALVLGRDERLGPVGDHPAGEPQQDHRRHDDRPPVVGREFEHRVVRVLDPAQRRR